MPIRLALRPERADETRIPLPPLRGLEPTDHPLAVEQREGITWGRVQEIAELVLHGRPG